MSCGGRVYKGDTIVISVPFDVEDYENLVITYTTTGDAKVVKTEDEVTIEDGFITYVSDGGELDLLPDGVIYYTISYEVDGVDHVESTNTPLYLKTPAGYSGKTADDIYQDGYEAGLNDCSGTSCMLYAGEYVLDSQFDGNSGVMYPDAGYNGFNSFLVTDGGYGQAKYDSGYTTGYNSGYTKGYSEANQVGLNLWLYREDTTSNLLIGKTTSVKLNDYTLGDMQWSEGSGFGNYLYWLHIPKDEVPEIETIELEFNAFESPSAITEDNPYKRIAVEQPHLVFNNLTINDYELEYLGESGDEQYPHKYRLTYEVSAYPVSDWGKGYASGYTDGLNDCSGSTPCDCSSAVTEAFQSGYTDGYQSGLNDCSGSSCNIVTGATDIDETFPIGFSWEVSVERWPESADGFSSVMVYDMGFGQSKFDSGFSAGYLSGISTTDCSEAIAEAYESGWTAGQAECGGSAYPVTFKVEKNEQVYAMNLHNNDVVFLRINNVEVEDIDFSKFYAGSSGNPSYIDVSGKTNQNLLDVSRVELKLFAPYGYFPDEWDKIYLNGNEIRDFAQNCTSASTEDGTVYQYLFNLNECDCTEAFESGWTAGFNSGLTSSEAFQSGYTAGEESARGNIDTIEIKFNVENNVYNYYPSGVHPIIVSVMASGGTYVGTYQYDYYDSSCGTYLMTENWDSAGRTAIYQFKGVFKNASQPSKYLDIDGLGIEILDSNLNSWGNWSVEYAMFNGQPLVSNCNLSIGGGGFKVVPDAVTANVHGVTPNTHQVLLHFGLIQE